MSGRRLYADRDGEEEVRKFDFVVVATGLYGHRRLADVPDILGRENFPGTVCHASEMPAGWEPSPRERIVVLGAGPTALAYAEAAGVVAEREGDVHLVVRTARWMIPRKFLGILPHCSILFNRINAMFIPAWRHEYGLEWLLHSWPFTWLVWAFWAFVEAAVFWSCEWPPALVPPRGKFLYELRNAVPVLPEKLFGLCHTGYVVPHSGVTVEKVTADCSVHLSDGTVIRNVNRVVLGTGYKLDEFEWMEDSLRLEVIKGSSRQLFQAHRRAEGAASRIYWVCDRIPGVCD